MSFVLRLKDIAIRLQQVYLGIFLLALIVDAFAMDVSPYLPGQLLSKEQGVELKQRYLNRRVQDWKAAPDRSGIDTRQDAELIHYGIAILDRTVETIGPKVADETKRYSGNSLNCSSCHQKGADGLPGAKYYAIPFNNIVNDYPNFRARSMTIGTAADRVNGCMSRSMGDGKALPENSREMRAILAYFNWLAEGSVKDQAMQGTGLKKMDLPARAANVGNGKKIYQSKCEYCHGVDGIGTKSPDYATLLNYQFPPLAGDDSFNDGAGMSRVIKAAYFIHSNMPFGTAADTPALSTNEAFDVAGYIVSLERPHKKERENDFPDKKFRPVDYPVPEYFNGDAKAVERAKYGPFD